jgi:SMODS-associating 2TM, beta-strand rich effector domain
MTDPKQARYVAIGTLYVASLIILIEGIGSTTKFIQSTSWIPLAVVIVATVYERWAWAWGPFGVPRIGGTWRITMHSTWTSGDEAEKPVVRSGYLVVRQTATQLTINLMTSESPSISLAARLQKRGDNQYELSWIYQNVPSASLREGSPIHFGCAIAEYVAGRNVQRLAGSYFTDRKTTGDFVATDNRRRIRVASWKEGEDVFGSRTSE